LKINPDDSLVGVNLTNENFVTTQQPELFQKVAEFLDTLIEKRRARVLFYSNEVRDEESFDNAAALKTLALMKNRNSTFVIPNDYRTPQQMLSLISCCDLTVSMRYHFCLFSALQKVPFIALTRSDKVDDLCWDLRWPYATTLAQLDAAALLEMSDEIERSRVKVTQVLQQQTLLMRDRSLKNSAGLAALLSS
jgi:polysaccharide pyruvyl transferase WcaK-like protein